MKNIYNNIKQGFRKYVVPTIISGMIITNLNSCDGKGPSSNEVDKARNFAEYIANYGESNKTLKLKEKEIECSLRSWSPHYGRPKGETIISYGGKKIIDYGSNGLFDWEDKYNIGPIEFRSNNLSRKKIKELKKEYDSLMTNIPKWHRESCDHEYHKKTIEDYSDTLRLPNNHLFYPGIKDESGHFYGKNLEEKSRINGTISYIAFSKEKYEEKADIEIDVNNFNTSNNINRNTVARRALLRGDRINTTNIAEEKKEKPFIVMNVNTPKGITKEYTLKIKSENEILPAITLDRFEKGDVISIPTLKPTKKTHALYKNKIVCSKCEDVKKTNLSDYLDGYRALEEVDVISLQKIKKLKN